MSQELKQISDGNTNGMGEFNPELADIFSLGITFLRFELDLTETEIQGMNSIKTGEELIYQYLDQVVNIAMYLILKEMLKIEAKQRIKILELADFVDNY